MNGKNSSPPKLEAKTLSSKQQLDIKANGAIHYDCRENTDAILNQDYRYRFINKTVVTSEFTLVSCPAEASTDVWTSVSHSLSAAQPLQSVKLQGKSWTSCKLWFVVLEVRLDHRHEAVHVVDGVEERLFQKDFGFSKSYFLVRLLSVLQLFHGLL